MAGPLDFKHDSTNPRGYTEYILGIIFLALSWITILARILARKKIKSFGLDDYSIVAAQIVYTGFVVSTLRFLNLVPGSQAKDLKTASQSIEWVIVNESCFEWSMIFLKLSLGAFFLRILVSKPQRQLVYAVMAVSSTVNFIMFWWVLFDCTSPKDYLQNHLAGKCISRTAQIGMAYFQASINCLSDIIFAILPFVMLRGSRMSSKIKIYVQCILVFASIGCVASIARFFFVDGLFRDDTFYTSVAPVSIVGTVELGTGLIASSLVTLRPLLTILVELAGTIRSSITNRTLPRSGTGEDPELGTGDQTELNDVKLPRYREEDDVIPTQWETSSTSRENLYDSKIS